MPHGVLDSSKSPELVEVGQIWPRLPQNWSSQSWQTLQKYPPGPPWLRWPHMGRQQATVCQCRPLLTHVWLKYECSRRDLIRYSQHLALSGPIVGDVGRAESDPGLNPESSANVQYSQSVRGMRVILAQRPCWCSLDPSPSDGIRSCYLTCNPVVCAGFGTTTNQCIVVPACASARRTEAKFVSGLAVITTPIQIPYNRRRYGGLLRLDRPPPLPRYGGSGLSLGSAPHRGERMLGKVSRLGRLENCDRLGCAWKHDKTLVVIAGTRSGEPA